MEEFREMAASRSRAGSFLFMLTIAAMLVSAGLIIAEEAGFDAQSSPAERWAVGSGDNMSYEIAGSRNGVAVLGAAYANFTDVNITSNGRMIGGYFFTDLGSWTGTGVSSGLSDPSLGFCLGQTSISTDFGTKHVTRCVSYHYDLDVNVTSVVMVYAGVESRVIYRVNVSAPTFSIHLELSNATVANPEQLDQNASRRMNNDAIRPSEEGFNQIFNAHGGWSAGFWDLPEGTIVGHSLEGNGSVSYFFTEVNIEHMEHGGLLESDTELSILNPPGNRTTVLGGGVYLAVTDVAAATGETREHFDFDYPS